MAPRAKGQHEGSRPRSALAPAAVQRGKTEGSPGSGIKAYGGVELLLPGDWNEVET
jgi:hypothetical protein